ncbi:hypothetical protein ACFOWM_06105 [Ferruginibacter yonginensis]|uniref:Integrase catalytic domain-containing protein n=1 Tax=Ferruginibacter yonginensis TaxID=1310416 RepID=A0ABV8QU25_9BACT
MVQLIDNKPYLHKELITSLGITTERYLWNGKKKPAHWDIRLNPDNKKQMLIGYEALLDEHKNKIVESIGNPYELVVRQPILSMIKHKTEAYQFFTKKGLTLKRVLQYTRAEAILTFLINHTNIKDIRKTFGMDAPAFYSHITEIIDKEKVNGFNIQYEGQQQLDGKFPSSYSKLIKRSREYAATNYDFNFFVHPNFGNAHRLKVTDDTEQLLNDIYVLNEKPNYTKVHTIYTKFLKGKISLVNRVTGEVYDHTQYKELSVSTVYSYVSAWENKVVTQKKRSSDKIAYNDTHRPYVSLERPHFAGSLISMDDRDLPFKTINNIRVKAYLAMDVASECFIAHSFNATDKDLTLVYDCFTNMYHNLEKWGYNQPAEVEVEQHLMSSLKEGILKEGALFPYVRFAQGANPQEKSIENAFRRVRYTVDKQVDGWIPRPFAKDEANQSRTEDDIKTAYTPEQVIAIAKANIDEWNNQLHFNQKEFKGLTRLQVWQQKQNENLLPIRWQQVAKYLGKKTPSSINRGEIRAFNSLYVLDDINQRAELENGKDLTINGFEKANGSIDEVYVYKNDELICTAYKKLRTQKARIEQTEEDKIKMAHQRKYIAVFDAKVKAQKQQLNELAIINNDAINKIDVEDVQIIETVKEQPVEIELNDNTDYQAMAIDNL